MWESVLYTVITPALCTIILYTISVNFVRHFMGNSHIPIRDVSKNHNWTTINMKKKVYCCSICEVLLLNFESVICDCCGVCADSGCIKYADKQLACKAIALNNNNDEPMKHHWIKGNLSPGALCYICNEECDTEPGLIDCSCCWCQRCVHEICKPTENEICDYGKFKLMIIPPTSLKVIKVRRNTIRRRLQLTSIIPPTWPDWKPLIVVANKKSGNNDGKKILSMFRRILNPAQVTDLSECDPIAALEWSRMLGDKPSTVLVAGGDGTIAWLLNAIHTLQLKPNAPAVAILPLGTGNDLSRVMGWGNEYNMNLEATDILQCIQNAQPVELDRWTVLIKSENRNIGFKNSTKSMFMYNYISVGVDAQVALNFHRTRESRFYLFSHRIFNKLLYLCFGTHQVVDRDCKNLDKRIEVYLDGKRIVLPSSESIVILNIPFWGGGVKLWELGRDNENIGVQSINDGLLEVCALYSSFHIAQLQVGLSQPHRLGQAKTIKIKLLDSCAVQIDGEPWYQCPCEFTITHCNRASMLMSS
ncbi:hypothetical protein PV328_010754 [Microctonus aethiopoides]|uniref:Diacylglycerol kinase n=1 Tax=Microctonus aethiopoides TaxID=144406 RepID=A0AA39KQM9_9HYME|nr:hypothetical protein PV328_010754 [Microctonus aethiopoides]